MRRIVNSALGLVLVILSIVATGPMLAATAQDATPVPVPAGAVDVTIEPLSSGLPAADGYRLSLLRVTFAPGGSIGSHTHPGSLVLTVTDGALTYAIIEGEAEIVRAGDGSTPGPTELLTAGQETVLTPGDALFEQGIVHTARNAGDEPSVVLVSGLMDPDHPFTMFMEATPTP
ncbi:MAG: cupin domain-containing protein [Chloroflexia bacterium]|nr:cupin domain-containing protein [Chloroflexia bacterium]